MENRVNAHGGNIYKAAVEFGLQKEDFLDFSANINPYGVPDSIKESILSGIDSLVHYPDPDCNELKGDISKYLGVSEKKIMIGNGASEVIFLLFEILKPRRVLIPAPSFSEYTRAAQSCGVEVEFFETRQENNFQLDIQALIEKLESGIDGIMLCNPNNPTSTLLDRKSLIKLLEEAKRRHIFVFLDEAFIELTAEGNQNSMTGVLDRFENLFIIRAFTKLFAVPGLRLGYGLGCETVIREMWKRKIPWSVNSFACSLGRALFDKEYLQKTAQWLREELDWLYRELEAIPGIKPFRPNTNFILVHISLKHLQVGMLRHRMARQGILIRDASNFMFLNEQFFRLAVKDRRSNERMLEVLREEVY